MIELQENDKLFTILVNNDYCQGLFKSEEEAELEAIKMYNSYYLDDVQEYEDILDTGLDYVIVREIIL